MGHIFTVASGFGLRLIPKSAPYRMRRRGRGVDVECASADGWRFGRIIPDEIGGYTSEVDDATASIEEVVDVVAGRKRNGWWLETSSLRLPFPRRWTLLASEQDGPVPFDLVGPGGAAIYVQTGSRSSLPPPEGLVAPGQTLRAQGGSDDEHWAEVTYVHDGTPWFQRHTVVPLGRAKALVTIQSPEAEVSRTRPVYTRIVERLVARDPRSRRRVNP